MPQRLWVWLPRLCQSVIQVVGTVARPESKEGTFTAGGFTRRVCFLRTRYKTTTELLLQMQKLLPITDVIPFKL